ncbi:MAG: decarboxylase [Polaromonas sp.]|nr:decarboxylase [Polaromonas sp.]
MSNSENPQPPLLHGLSIIDGLKRARVEFVVSLPDICTSENLLRPISAEPAIKLVRVCKEDEGVSICAALSFCDRRGLLLMQQTGLMDSANALRAIAVDYRNPVCMMIGMLGLEPGISPVHSSKYGVRIVPAMLDVLGIRYQIMRSDTDIPSCMEAIETAYARSEPLAILLGSNPS